ncbi:TipAS antibiotic-recognition domain-containing protein [Nonomuraea sp. NPDC046802]|uniref:MerR family transcriptional regulator n=1 Tax=Nonomuraea sp. NPDC046802 TaxID=3154919 RepID=UPI0033F4018E
MLRELGLGLTEIKEIVERHTDPITALREHHRGLLAERDRLDGVARMVGRTIAELQENEGRTTMSKISRPENLFEGFNSAQYEADARERWPEQWQQSGQQALLAGRTPQELEQMQREATAGMIRMAEHMLAGAPVDAPQVFAELDVHYRHLSESWTPTAAQYLHLARMQAQEERFRANYEQVAEGLAAYMRDAMTAYAHARLT